MHFITTIVSNAELWPSIRCNECCCPFLANSISCKFTMGYKEKVLRTVFAPCTLILWYVLQPLDYEISAFHTLLIKVENEDPLIPDIAYGPSSTATVQITVEDVNEGPVFHPNPMTVTKQENIPVGSVVLTVNATDPDTLQHQTIRWVQYPLIFIHQKVSMSFAPKNLPASYRIKLKLFGLYIISGFFLFPEMEGFTMMKTRNWIRQGAVVFQAHYCSRTIECHEQ